MSKELENKIEKKLAKLSKLLDKIEEARIINSDDPDTWNSEALYDLKANLQETLQLLADQKDKKLDDWGQPLVLEIGLCSLLDDWESQKEAEND